MRNSTKNDRVVLFSIVLGLVFSTIVVGKTDPRQCSVGVVAVNVPAFLVPGERNVYGYTDLYARRTDGQPDWSTPRGGSNWYVKEVPNWLKDGETSSTQIFGLVHGYCLNSFGTRTFVVYQASILFTQAKTTYLPNFGSEAELTLSAQGGEMMSRVKLVDSDGLVQERQMLPFPDSGGPVRQVVVSDLFANITGSNGEIVQNYLTRSNWWIEIVSPVESPVQGILQSEDGLTFTQAETLTSFAELTEPGLITNVGNTDLFVFGTGPWSRFSRLKPGQSLRRETPGRVSFNRPALVSTLRTLDPQKPDR